MIKFKNLIKNITKKNKFYYVLAICVLIFSLSVIIPSLAQYDNIDDSMPKIQVWDGSVSNSFGGGSGKVDDPYIISNGSELAYLALMLKETNFENTYFNLSNDIIINPGIFNYNNDIFEYLYENKKYYIKDYTNELYDNADFNNTSIGNINSFNTLDNFNGVLNGNNHTIYGLYINNESDNTGFFNNLNGTVENLFLKNVLIYGKSVVGGLASNASNANIKNIIVSGYVINDNNNNVKTINDELENIELNVNNNSQTEVVSLNNTNVDGYILSKKLIGNVSIDGVGEVYINNIPVNGDFEIDLTSLDSFEILYSSLDTANIVLSNLSLNIEYDDTTSGGIIGIANNVYIQNSVNKAKVYSSAISGGLVSRANGLSIINSYNTGNINSLYISGGFVGFINNGGHISISNSYNNALVNSNVNGGLIGSIESNIESVDISNSFDASNNQYLINSINNSVVNANNLYYINYSNYSGNINGSLYQTTFDDLSNSDFLKNNLYFNEYVSDDDLINNENNLWVYDYLLPKLYFDKTVDKIANIHLSSYTWDGWSDQISELEFEEPIAFNIEVIDDLNPAKEIYYYIDNSNVVLSQNDLANVNWQSYNDIVEINEAGSYIIYAKVIDSDNNIYYLNSDIIKYNMSDSVVLSINDNQYSDFNNNLNELYYGEKVDFTVLIKDYDLIKNVEYYISNEILSEDDLNLLSEEMWNIYTDPVLIDKYENNIIYLKVTTSFDEIIYINSDIVKYNGYTMIDLNAGQSITNDIINITNKSSVSVNFEFNDNITYNNYKHYLISSEYLPDKTNLILIDNKENKVYKYTVDESKNYNYDNNCNDNNCEFQAIYDFSLFTEVGNVNSINYVENNTNIIDDSFTIIVDFKNTNIENNIENISLGLILRNDDKILIPILKDTIRTFNIYVNDSISPIISSDFNGIINPSIESCYNINLNIGVKEEYINGFLLNNTLFETKKMGIGIKFVDEDGNLVDKSLLSAIRFSMDGVVYSFDNSNIVKIPISGSLINTSKSLLMEISNSSNQLINKNYKMIVFSYISNDNIYFENISNELVYEFNNNSVLNGFIDVSVPSSINSNDSNLKVNVSYQGNLLNPNIKLSLYKKEKLTAYDQNYILVDLQDYFDNKLTLFNDTTYNLFDILNESNVIDLLINDFEYGGYKFVFDLYDGNTKIDTVEKAFIVKY